VLWPAIVVILSLFANIMPIRNAAKLTISKVPAYLAYE
jgi:hypothetical protein